MTVKNLRSDVTYLVTVYWVPGTNAVSGKYTMWTSYQQCFDLFVAELDFNCMNHSPFS